MYWAGNSAKSRIIDEVTEYAVEHPEEAILVFDFGCGVSAPWPNILTRHKNISYVGFDPSLSRIAEAKHNLRGYNAQLLSSADLQAAKFKAKFILSFSVLEHVYDRASYLRKAHMHLADGGTFYLNYDDGHFRRMVDLSAPLSWPRRYRTYFANKVVEWQAKRGIAVNYKRRVHRTEIDMLVPACGFQVVDSFYSNLVAFKEIYKTVPPEQREIFSRFWIDTEATLNACFKHQAPEKYGDDCNLWGHMASRTLVLRRIQAGAMEGPESDIRRNISIEQ